MRKGYNTVVRWVIALGILVLTVPTAHAQVIVGDYEIEFISAEENEDGTQTWSYRVTELDGATRDLSHWILELCGDARDDLNGPDDWSPDATDAGISDDDGVEVGTSGVTYESTEVTGTKWNVEDDFDNDGGDGGDSRIFTFTLSETYGQTNVNVGTKGGQNNRLGTIIGPDCSTICEAPQEIESSEVREDGFGYITTTFTADAGVQAVTFTKLDNLVISTVPAEYILGDTDSDLDGMPDSSDPDDDNDGIPDANDIDNDGDGENGEGSNGNITYVYNSGMGTPPSTAVFELKQEDTEITTSTYFAVARSECGTVTLFDPVRIFDTADPLSNTLEVEDSYPNPFRVRTTTQFTLAEPTAVTLSVYDVAGRKVALLLDRTLSAGTHEVSWDGQSMDRQSMASGVYFIRIEAGSQVQTQRVVRIK